MAFWTKGGGACSFTNNRRRMYVLLYSFIFTEFSYIIAQNTYGAAIQTLEQVGKVVDSLYAKVRVGSPALSSQPV